MCDQLIISFVDQGTLHFLHFVGPTSYQRTSYLRLFLTSCSTNYLYRFCVSTICVRKVVFTLFLLRNSKLYSYSQSQYLNTKVVIERYDRWMFMINVHVLPYTQKGSWSNVDICKKEKKPNTLLTWYLSIERVNHCYWSHLRDHFVWTSL